jgi:transketolase
MAQIIAENRNTIDDLCINTIRTLAIDAIEAAKSGHPGAPMGMAPAAYVLWTRILKHNPRNPDWIDRDRFVLSAGHASMMLYSLLFLCGYDLSLDDIKSFRQWASKTPGHPEYGHSPGVEITTGPLGQGFASAVGMAMAERHLAACFNRNGQDIVDHYTYVMCGDGDLMEGVACEAASLAGHLGLAKLIAVYDDNKITIEGGTDITFTEDVAQRFEAYNWHVLKVGDGNDLTAIQNALDSAKAESEKPSLILLQTHIAYGSPNKQDSCSAHGAPLGEEEVRLTKECLGCPADEVFCVPPQVSDAFQEITRKGIDVESAWQAKFDAYANAYPELAEQLSANIKGELPVDWDADLPLFEAPASIATRSASGQTLNVIASKLPVLIGGSADLAPSNNTIINSSYDFQKDAYGGRNIRFGVREHAMGAIISGMALHKGVRPYGGTFLVFADYMRPSIRLAAMMKLPVIYIFTHDSIAVGEDGPTHQPIEHLASLRIIPGLTVIRPADAIETVAAWQHAIMSKNAPIALLLSRQKLPVLEVAAETITSGVHRGGYILADSGSRPDAILIASGSEVHICIAAKRNLEAQGIATRVVSMPSWELFEKMTPEYRDDVLPPEVTARLAVEAGMPFGWERYVGSTGAVIGIDHFGASAPGGTVMEKFGFSADNVTKKMMEILNQK